MLDKKPKKKAENYSTSKKESRDLLEMEKEIKGKLEKWVRTKESDSFFC